jgi:hypothetical protein
MATSPGIESVLTPELIDRLVALADGPAVRGIALLGSAARGDASRWSDLDVESTVARLTDKWPTRPSLLDDRLVMAGSITHAEQLAQLEQPDKAIWAVPSYAAMRILVDRDGALARLQALSAAFDYAPLAPAATAYLREKAGSSCEYVFKIRDGVDRADRAKILHAAAALTGKCERIVSVAYLVPIPTENVYYRILEQSAGPDWSAHHRAAFGLAGGDERAQGEAAVRLFRETVRLIDQRLDVGVRTVIERALEIAP